MMDPHIWPLEWPDFAPMFVPSQSERVGHGTLDQMHNDGRSVDYDKYRARRRYSPTQSRSRWNRARDHLRGLAHISDCEGG